MKQSFSIVQLPLITSLYWPLVSGREAADAEHDLEGLRTMRMLGHNMAYHLKCKAAGAAEGILPPAPEPPARTNFIR